jgi:hypothetical protein
MGLQYILGIFTPWPNTFNYHTITIQLQYNMTLAFNHINCLAYIYNNKRISSGYDWLSFIYHLTTMSKPSCGPIRKYFAKNAEYDEEEGMCFTFNKTYDGIFFLSTSLMSTPVSTPNHSKKHHQCDHIMKIRYLFDFNIAGLFLAKHR